MNIPYALQEDRLTATANGYTARVQFTATVDLQAVARRMVEQGAEEAEADIAALLERIAPACGSLLLEGKRVKLGGLCMFSPSVQGTFQGPKDHFDPARHRVNVGASAGQALRKMVQDSAHVEKVEASKPLPVLVQYTDLASGETDGKFTPGNIGSIDGYRLKFDPAQPDEGVFLVPAEGTPGKETRISQMQTNKPGQLVFLNPANTRKGEYHLEVRARQQSGSELRIGLLEAMLTVLGAEPPAATEKPPAGDAP